MGMKKRKSQPNTDGLNVEAAGIELNGRGFIKADETLRTRLVCSSKKKDHFFCNLYGVAEPKPL